MDPSTQVLFQQTGLYHLLVVSGAHLIFLEKILNHFLKGRDKTQLAIYVFFAIVCQMNPPILRALFSQSLKQLSERKRLFLNDETRILVAGLWCLLLFPQWILSTSLMLSWVASLALNYQIQSWKKHFTIAIYLLPWTQTFSPATVINNLLFGFLFEWFLFPISFVCFLVPGLSEPGNQLWNFTTLWMTWLPSTSQMTPFSNLDLWPYIFILHLFHRLKR